MPYLGNDLQVAQPSYRNIDDISGSFNGVTTSFPLTVSGVAPVPFPINSNQCLISVAGVVQRPDDSGTEGFRISGANIIFSSAPSALADFFGVILAGADYVNVGANFPSGSAAVPSITFDSDLDTGIYNSAANQVSITTAGVERLRVDSAGQIESVSLGTAAAPAFSFTTDPNTGIYSPGADQVAVATNGTGRLFVASDGKIGIGGTPFNPLDVFGSVTVGVRYKSSGSYAGIIADNTSSTGGGYFGAYQNGTQKAIFGATGAFTGDTSADAGVFAETGQAIRFFTNGSVTEKMRITSAGLVGIGTNNPLSRLHVEDSGEPVIYIRRDTTSATSLGGPIWRNNSFNVASIITQNVNANSADLTFSTSSGGSLSERARIDSSGRLLVGTSTSLNANALTQAYKASGSIFNYTESGSLGNTESVTVRASANASARVADIGIYKHSSITNPCAYLYLQEEDAGAAVYWTDNSNNFRISNDFSHVGTTSGTVVGTQTSDERLKNILGPVEYGLATLKQIEPVRYALKTEPDTEKLGFIAQQVLPLVPQSVFDTDEHIEGEPEDAPTKLGMEYVALIPVLVNAIKELSDKNDALEARLTVLESQP